MKKWIAIAMILCMLLPAASFAAGYDIDHLDTEELSFDKKKTVTAYVVDLTELDWRACYADSPREKAMICDTRLSTIPVVLLGDIRDCYGIQIRYTEDVISGSLNNVLHRPYVELTSGEWTWGDAENTFNAFQGRDSYCSVLFKTPQAFGACSVEFAKAKSSYPRGTSFEYNVIPQKLYFETEEAGFRYIESVVPGSTPYADYEPAGTYSYGNAKIAPYTIKIQGTRTELETYRVDLTGYSVRQLGEWSDNVKRMQVSRNWTTGYFILDGQIDDCYGIQLDYSIESEAGTMYMTPFRVYVQQLDSKWYAGDTDSMFTPIEGRSSTTSLFFKNPISMVAVSVELSRAKSHPGSGSQDIIPTYLFFRTEKAAKAYVDSLG